MRIVQQSFLDGKRCRKCNEWKPLSDFYPTKGYRDGHHSYCKACSKIQAAQSQRSATGERRERKRETNRVSARRVYARDVEKARAKRRASSRRYPEISRVASLNYLARKKQARGSFTTAEWKAVCEKYGYRCLWCGEQKKLEPDHVIPLASGGDNTIDNIQPLCRACNGRKSNRHLDFR